jgi:hypothetical protein
MAKSTLLRFREREGEREREQNLVEWSGSCMQLVTELSQESVCRKTIDSVSLLGDKHASTDLVILTSIFTIAIA